MIIKMHYSIITNVVANELNKRFKSDTNVLPEVLYNIIQKLTLNLLDDYTKQNQPIFDLVKLKEFDAELLYKDVLYILYTTLYPIEGYQSLASIGNGFNPDKFIGEVLYAIMTDTEYSNGLYEILV